MCRRSRSRSSRKCNATLVTEHVRVRQTSACKLLRRSSAVCVDCSTLIRTTMVVQLLSFFRTRRDWELSCCESVGQTLRQSKDTSNFALWPVLCVAVDGRNLASSCASRSHVKGVPILCFKMNFGRVCLPCVVAKHATFVLNRGNTDPRCCFIMRFEQSMGANGKRCGLICCSRILIVAVNQFVPFCAALLSLVHRGFFLAVSWCDRFCWNMCELCPLIHGDVSSWFSCTSHHSGANRC